MLKDSIYAAQAALRIGIENSQELLAKYDVEFGRDHRSNRLRAEQMEREIAEMKLALGGLDKPNGTPYAGCTPSAPQGVRRMVDVAPQTETTQS